MTDKTSTEILEDGLRRLEECGWRQGGFGNAKLGYCALGAMQWNFFCCEDVYEEAKERLAKVIADDDSSRNVNGYVNVEIWNDDPHRTKEDVILAFKKAIHDE